MGATQMKTKRKKKAAKSTLAVAVVVNANGSLSGRSHRDWASFVHSEEKLVVTAAIKAAADWQAEGYGPYSILVGTLTRVAEVPTNYKLAAIPEPLKGGSL